MPLAQALVEMKFVSPTPVQTESIPPALQGKDILGTAQTGTGKTGAFGIPMMKHLYDNEKIRGLILAPTRELAVQIHTVLKQMAKKTNIVGVCLIGGESFNRQANDLYRGWDYIVATPGRLNDHIERRTVSLEKVKILVLDEVDRMLDMGFIPQIRQIMRHVPEQRQTLLFSATLPNDVTRLAQSFLKDPVRVAIGAIDNPIDRITQTTIHTSQEGKNSHILNELKTREGLVLVFARTKHRTDRLQRLLHQAGHRAVAMHGGRSQSQRQTALESFKRGTHRIMVATDLAGRGIDVAGIEHVINYDTPSTREDYIHRIGRTGRYGKKGDALNFVIAGDREEEAIVTGEKVPGRRPAYQSRPRNRQRYAARR